MFYAKPQLLDAEPTGIEAPPLPGQEFAGSLEVLSTSFDATRRADSTNANDLNLSTIYDEHNKRVRDLTGVDLMHPINDVVSAREAPQIFRDWKSYSADGGGFGFHEFERLWSEKRYREELNKLTEKHPDLRDQLMPDMSFIGQAYAKARQAEQRAADTMARSRGGLLDYGASFAGGMGGAMLDPVNIITAPLGFGGVGTGAKGLLMGMIKSGGINAGTEAASQPFIQEFRARAGLDYGLGQAVGDVATAAAAGAGLDLIVRGAWRGGRLMSGYVPVVENGIVVGYRRRGEQHAGQVVEPVSIPPELAERAKAGDQDAQAEIDRLINPAGDLIKAETVARAEAGDAVAIREIAEASGADVNPVTRQMLDAMDANEALQVRPRDTVSEVEHGVAVTQALRHVADPEREPMPVRIIESPVAGIAEALDARAAAIKELGDADPRLKAYVDQQLAQGRADTVELLARATGLLAQGRAVATAAAEIAGRAVALTERVLATKGDAIGLAHIERETPGLLSDALPFADASVRLGQRLAALSDDAFADVAGGRASTELAALVADFVADPVHHSRMLADLTKAAPQSETHARHLIAEMLASPDYRPEQPDLSPSPLADKQLDDTGGAEAKKQVAELERKMADELGQKAAAEVPPTPEQVVAERREAIGRVDAIRDLVRDVVGVSADDLGVKVRVFSSAADLPSAAMRLDMERANANAYALALERFMSAADEAERAAARGLLDAAQRGEGVAGFELDGTVWIAAYAANPRAYVAHELVHALRRMGNLRDDEVATLAQRARALGVFDKAREKAYRDTLAGRPEIDRLIEEEAAARLIEHYFKGGAVGLAKAESGILDRLAEMLAAVRQRLMAMLGRQDEPVSPPDAVRQIIEAFRSGEIARREVAAERAVAVADAMRSSDLTAVAVREGGQPRIVSNEARAAKLREEIASLERGPQEYAGPESATPISQGEIDALVDTWRYVNDMRRAKKPETLTQWLVRTGRVKDQNGELTNILGGRSRHMISGKGRNLDDAALAAWEAGYLRGGERPTIREFLDAVDDDVRGNRRVRVIDEAAEQDISAAREMETELDRIGLGSAKSEDDIRAYFTRKGGEGTTGSPETAGRAERLAEARAELASLELEIQSLNDSFMAALSDLDMSPEARKARAEDMGFDTSRVWYHGTRRQFEAFDPQKALADLEARGGPFYRDRPRMVFLSADKTLPMLFGSNDGGRLLEIYAKRDLNLFDGSKDANKLASFIQQNEEAIRSKLSMPPDGTLIDDVRKGWQVLETKPVQDWLRSQGYDGFIASERFRQDAEGKANKILAVFDTANAKGALRSVNAAFDPARADSPNLMFAFADRDTGQGMRRDLDALGFYSQALEAARNLKQAKGTPEQMLAQLRNAGVKANEIEATGLGQFLEGKPTITRDEIVAHLEGNRVGVREVRYGGRDAGNDTLEHMVALTAQLREIANDRREPVATELRRAADRIDRQRDRDPLGFDNPAFWEGLTSNEEASDVIIAAQDMVMSAQSTPRPQDAAGTTKWSSLSLDPSNPSYRETVLHLPKSEKAALKVVPHPTERGFALQREDGTFYETRPGRAAAWTNEIHAQQAADSPDGSYDTVNFRSGHFPEPNIIGHLMTSMVKHQGRPVYLIDQIQSDWGQKVRDGGVRDEAKIADLRNRLDAGEAAYADVVANEVAPIFTAAGKMPPAFPTHAIADLRMLARNFKTVDDGIVARAQDMEKRLLELRQPMELVGAELRTAEAATPGNPLVNTTDQWTTTTLRRALRQAAEADADYIAIPHGDTVLSYNPGDTDGMRGFYGSRTSEGIVPKNLRKLIEKLDKDAPKPVKVESLETPTRGMVSAMTPPKTIGPDGYGFTLFPLTDTVKAKVRTEGQAMFAFAGEQIDKMPEPKGRYRLVGGPGETPPEMSRARAGVKAMASYLGMAVEYPTQAVSHVRFYKRNPDLGTPGEAVRQVKEAVPGAKSKIATLQREASGQQFYYDIQGQDGESVGTAYGWVVGKKMYFDWLGGRAGADANRLGIRVIKDLREQVRKDFPQVNQFVGYRVSGARHKADATNRMQSVTMFALRDLAERNNATLIEDIKVDDPSPRRILAFHGTAAPDRFERFDTAFSTDFGVHFGTADQATDRAGSAFPRSQADEASRLIPVVLEVDPNRVVTISDQINWDPVQTADAIAEQWPKARAGIFRRALSDVVERKWSRANTDYADNPSAVANETLRDQLLNRGIEAVRYRNSIEGAGWSYIAIKPGTVRSATSGQMMFAFADDAPARSVQAIDIPSLAARIMDVAAPYIDAIRARSDEPTQDRSIATVTVRESTLPIDAATAGAVLDVARTQAGALAANPEAVRPTIAATISSAADSYGVPLPPDRADAIAGEALDILQSAPADPLGALNAMTEMVNRVAGELSNPMMFAMRDEQGRPKAGAAQRAKNLQDDLAALELRFQAAGADERAKLQEKRATLLQAAADERVLDDVRKFTRPDGQRDPAEGLMRLVESDGRRGGAVDLRHQRDVILDDFVSEMDKAVWHFRKGAITGDLKRKMPSLKRDMQDVIRVAFGEAVDNPFAKTMADGWLAAKEKARQRFNAAGGDIGKLDVHAMPQYHDADAWLNAGRQAVIDYFVPAAGQPQVLDRSKMLNGRGERMSDVELKRLMSDIWLTVTTGGANKIEPGVATMGRGALYKQHAEHRVLHFANADAYLAYNKLYGGGDLYAAMIGHLSTMARDVAAMERFGPNPKLGLERAMTAIRAQAAVAQSAKSLYEELVEKHEALKTSFRSRGKETGDEQFVRDIGRILNEIQVLREEDRGRIVKKNAAEIDALDRDLMAVNLAWRDWASKQTSADQRGQMIIAQMSDVMDEMALLDPLMIISKNPIERTERLLSRAAEMWSLYSGHTNTPVQSTVAGFMSGLRNWVSATALTFASFSSVFSDQVVQAAGRSFIGMPVNTQLATFVKSFSAEGRQSALQLKMGLDQAQAAFAEQARFVGWINTRSVTGYVADRTHALSLLSPMTQALKVAFGWDFQVWMAKSRSSRFSELPDETQRMLKRHDISPVEWESLRKVEPETRQGVELLTSDAIRQSAGIDLAEKYMVMMRRERGINVLEGTLASRTLFLSESRPGSVLGEVARSVAMIKSFPTAYAMLVLGRMYDEVLAGRMAARSNLTYMAAILVAGTLFGGLAMQVRNLAQGRDPEDMRTARFWMAAFMQSGGLGIFGDFVGSSVNRMGGGLAQTIMGPLAGRASSVLDLTAGNVLQYASDERTSFGRELRRVVEQNTPGALVPFYLRLAYSRMILDEFQRMVDPDAHRSFAQQAQQLRKRTGQQFYYPPGGVARTPNLGAAVGQ